MSTKKRHRELYHEEIIKSTEVCRRWRIQLYLLDNQYMYSGSVIPMYGVLEDPTLAFLERFKTSNL